MAESYLSIGLMSGTSVDGIDAALSEHVVGSGGRVSTRLVAGLCRELGEPLRADIFSLFEDGPGSLDRLALLDMALGEAFADAALAVARAAGLGPADIAVIGSHGQTVRHVAGAPGSPRRASLQIGSGAVIAARTGIITASDFRPGDIAAGGTGAPLVPFFDVMEADRFAKPVAFQNYGGIGNVCYVPDSGDVVAFDTGPANMIVDRLALEMSGGRERFDRDGRLGALGSARPDLLDAWMRHPFLGRRPPKSTGREEFGAAFYADRLEPLLRNVSAGPERDALFADLVRTAEAFTAASTAAAYRDFLPAMPATVVVSGGGARNPIIMSGLRSALPSCIIVGADEAGLSVDYKEAMAFGLFGLCRLLCIPNTVPRATGAERAVSAGALYLP